MMFELENNKYVEGDYRIITRFTFIPFMITNEMSDRKTITKIYWFERIYILQKYVSKKDWMLSIRQDWETKSIINIIKDKNVKQLNEMLHSNNREDRKLLAGIFNYSYL